MAQMIEQGNLIKLFFAKCQRNLKKMDFTEDHNLVFKRIPACTLHADEKSMTVLLK